MEAASTRQTGTWRMKRERDTGWRGLGPTRTGGRRPGATGVQGRAPPEQDARRAHAEAD